MLKAQGVVFEQHERQPRRAWSGLAKSLRVGSGRREADRRRHSPRRQAKLWPRAGTGLRPHPESDEVAHRERSAPAATHRPAAEHEAAEDPTARTWRHGRAHSRPSPAPCVTPFCSSSRRRFCAGTERASVCSGATSQGHEEPLLDYLPTPSPSSSAWRATTDSGAPNASGGSC